MTAALASVVNNPNIRQKRSLDDPDPVLGVMRITAEGSGSAYQKLTT